jgi:predicted MFS family arabinose efflux permease
MSVRQASKHSLSTGTFVVLALGTFTLGTDGFVLNGLLPTLVSDPMP